MDISQRSIDSVKHRKRRGVTVGIPPFGTLRNDDGYLQPSPDGAWLLSDGTFVAGTEGDEAPEDGALWRGYFQAAERVLQLYAQNEFGLDTIAYKMGGHSEIAITILRYSMVTTLDVSLLIGPSTVDVSQKNVPVIGIRTSTN